MDLEKDLGVKPRALEERPTLDLRLSYYYRAYGDMSGSRNVGMGGPLKIPISEFLSYCILFKIESINERERLFRYVNSLDRAYLDWVAEKSKSQK